MAVGLLAVTLAGCGSSSGGGKAQASDNVLSLASIIEPKSYDPTQMDCGSALLYCQAAYDTLIHLDADRNPTPGMATAFTYNGKRTQLTLTLRSGITFSDGTPFDASVAAANLTHFQKTSGLSSSMSSALKSVRAVGADKVVIDLSAPDPSLLSNLALNLGMMVSKPAIGAATLATTPDGSGPYLLDKADTQPGTTVFKRNTKYWDPSTYPFDTVKMSVLTDPNTTLNAFKVGQVNAGPIGEPQAKAIEQLGGSVMRSANGWLGLILADRGGKVVPALADVRVRQAINYVLDRDLFSTIAVPGGKPATTTEQIFAPGSPAFVKELDEAYPHDVAKAKQLMAAAGYAKGFSVTMPDFSTVSGSPALSTYLVQQLGAINIKIHWANPPLTELISSIQGGKYGMTFMLLGSKTPWQDMQNSVLPNAPFNPFHSTDPHLARLINTAEHADPAQSPSKAFQAVNRWLVQNAWFAPFTIRGSVEAAGPGVKIEQQTLGVDLARFKPAGS